MSVNQAQYLSMSKLAKKYDISKDLIKRDIPKMKEGLHYIRVHDMYRFEVEEVHKFISNGKVDVYELPNELMNKFLLNN